MLAHKNRSDQWPERFLMKSFKKLIGGESVSWLTSSFSLPYLTASSSWLLSAVSWLPYA